MPKYIIGTRGSLLAKTQCKQTKNFLETQSTSKFELKFVSTQGDQQTEKPLWQMDGKDFFTKELDEKLLNGEVDIVVHSYKDLGSERPPGIELGAVTKRNYSSDILLIKKSKIQHLKNMKTFVVGTSSPRRIVNVESELANYLPLFQGSVSTKVLRGNVNTRIEKLLDDQYDAIVLAHAGLERLALGDESSVVLSKLLKDLTFLIMPLRDFPPCAAQGALGIELAQNNMDQQLRATLQAVHCSQTKEETDQERKRFVAYGGGCHLAVGIHVRSFKKKLLIFEKGIHQDQIIDKQDILNIDYSKFANCQEAAMMGESDFLVKQTKLATTSDAAIVYVTSSHCFHAINNPQALFAAGTRTAKKLVQAGYWVNATAEALGEDTIADLLESESLKIMLPSGKIQVLTHTQGKSSLGAVLKCYKRELTHTSEQHEVKQAYFWGSFYQYQEYTRKFPQIKSSLHACGLGKTYEEFIKNNISVTPFIGVKHFRDKCHEQ